LAALHEPWLCILVLAPMITLQRGALVRELETAATTDAKTGLLNATAWEQLAKREMNRADRERKPVSVLIVDVDRFKLVNDRFGHMAGDVVLRGIGRRLQTEVREYDSVGRFGGEEFVVVLPNANESEALVIAERLRSRVNELHVSQMVDGLEDFGDSPLSISIGVACSPTDGAELADLLIAADSALYVAKAGGRNRVVLAERGVGGRAPRLIRD
jgi:diguanylate cyclase (GGDEF)-like protein